jgi:glucose/arabinose dehydrogenase
MKTIIIVVIIAVIIVIAAGLSMSIEEPVEAKPWAGFDCTEMLDFSATSDHNLMDDIMHIEFHEHYMNSCSDIEVVDNESSFISEKVQLVETYPNLGVKVETISENLSIPWSIDFANDGRIFFSERTGTLQVIDGDVQKQILDLNVGGGEGGMLGIALDPDFESNHYIYIYYTYNELLSTKNKLVRYVESNNSLSEDKILLDDIPGASYHDGGRIKFGPDDKLYITTGDAGDPNLSQRLDSVAGKILRINSDGTIPTDNPFPNSLVYSYGHRNPQGIDWDKSGVLIGTEHGQSAHDEINLIEPGKNYGWPDVIGDEIKDGMTNPLLHSGDDTWAPSGGSFYYGDITQWNGLFFAASLRGEHLLAIEFDSEYNVISYEKLFLGEYGRLRDVVSGPDGLYVLTSNQDGRGSPTENDDRILRITTLYDNLEESTSQKCSGTARCIIGKVTKIVDGDTIHVNGESVRFALSSAPELGGFGGVESRDFIDTICPVGSDVIVDEDDSQTEGSYGRIIGVIYCNGVNLNSELLDADLGYLENQFCDSSEFAEEQWAIKHGC